MVGGWQSKIGTKVPTQWMCARIAEPFETNMLPTYTPCAQRADNTACHQGCEAYAGSGEHCFRQRLCACCHVRILDRDLTFHSAFSDVLKQMLRSLTCMKTRQEHTSISFWWCFTSKSDSGGDRRRRCTWRILPLEMCWLRALFST